MFSLSRQLSKLSLLAVLPALSACVEGGAGGGPGGYYPPPQSQPQQMCTMEYRPVCGERGGRQETFGNACQAGQRGFRVVRPGECRSPERPGRPDWDRPSRPEPGRPSRPERPDWDRPSRPEQGRPQRPDRPDSFCTREYQPVCGRQGRREQTFPNACEARNSNFDVVASGECRR